MCDFSLVFGSFSHSQWRPAVQVLRYDGNISINSSAKAFIFPQSVQRNDPECGKGFRYKVSQKAHVNKCSGTLVKQPGELIQKLMLNSSILPPTTVTTSTVVSNETINSNVEISNANQHESHELCLDDLLKDDSYEKLMKSSANETQLIPHLADNAFSDNSGMMAFNNLAINPTYCMTSLGNNNNFMNNMNFPPTLETINEDSIKELLGDFSR